MFLDCVLPRSPIEMREVIFSEIYRAVSEQRKKGADTGRVFDFTSLSNLDWFNSRSHLLFHSLHGFNSEHSKRLFLNVIAYRLASTFGIKVRCPFDTDSQQLSEFLNLQGGFTSKLNSEDLYCRLQHYDFVYEGVRYTLDARSLRDGLLRKQYFFEENEIVIKPEQGDYVIDAGACFGDTAVIFGKAVGRTGKVFAFDPVKEHQKIINFNILQNPDCPIVIMPFGVSDRNVGMEPIELGAYRPDFSIVNYDVPLRTIDSLVEDGLITRIDFLKMDIEGSELSALRGARNSIRRFNPKLAISLYHSLDDLHEIPAFLRSLLPSYSFYLGHYTIDFAETVLYGVGPINSGTSEKLA